MLEQVWSVEWSTPSAVCRHSAHEHRRRRERRLGRAQSARRGASSPGHEQEDEIPRIYLGLATRGEISPEDEAELHEIAHTLEQRDGVEMIALAGDCVREMASAS